MDDASRVLADWYHSARPRLVQVGISGSLESNQGSTSIKLDTVDRRSTIVAWDHNSAFEILALNADTGDTERLVEETGMSATRIASECDAHIAWLAGGPSSAA